ncbi:MAG: ATP-dependent helicase [Halobacteriales archaeon]|nr:ATP-dependent helicase [Halobacteriales archaeon]
MSIKTATQQYTDKETFATLSPEVRVWFEGKFGSFTPPQRYAVKEIHEGRNVLISSPTGSGKTLSAFLASINELFLLAKTGKLEDKVYVLYVSPLKALNNDIERNLKEPLAEIYAQAKEKGLDLPEIRVGVRTGDTPQKERAAQLRKSPHILITTPESLAINLIAPKFSLLFHDIRYIIVDEIHSLADNKRGVHLSLTLERLCAHIPKEPVRVGLSATISPMEEVARFLVGLRNGKERDCLIVDVNFIKQLDIKVESPVKDLIYTSTKDTNLALYHRLDELMDEHRTTLVFTNTRSATERVVFHLKKHFGDKYVNDIGAHHSSLSKEVRLDVESKLKRGELKCVVSSTSLELGIDIGYIDLTVLLGSPKSISRALQRIGRSGHKLHEQSKGRILVLDRDDLVECAVLARESRKRNVDRIHIPMGALDVLAQHLFGLSLEQRWELDDAISLVRRAYPYKDITEDEVVRILRYLSGSYEELEARKVYGKLWFDEESRQFGRRGRMARAIYYTNIGVIPDEVAAKVMTTSGEVKGKLEEEFVEQLKHGDIFVLGGNTYEFLKSSQGRVIVEPRPGAHPTIPAWFSEMLPLSYDLAGKVREFRGWMAQRMDLPKARALKELQAEFDLDKRTAEAMWGYFDEQRRFSLIPTDQELLVEEVLDEEGRVNYVFHTTVGRRANDALSRAFAHKVSKFISANVRVTIHDNGFVLSYPMPPYRDPERGKLKDNILQDLWDIEDLEKELQAALHNTEILKRRFRHVATRSLLILRNYLGYDMSVGRQQRAANILFKVVREIDRDFPALKETYREIMRDAMDLENAKHYAGRVAAGDITVVVTRGGKLPSPFAFNLVAVGSTDVVMMEDRKLMIRNLHRRVMMQLEEREAQAGPASAAKPSPKAKAPRPKAAPKPKAKKAKPRA